MKNKINFPKIIHQTYRDNNLPDNFKKSSQEWQRLNKDWIYKLWTDAMIDDYINTKHPQYKKMFDNFPYKIQKIDTIRYFILFDFGGVYSDLDIVPLKSLDEYDFGDSDLYLMKSINTPCLYTNSFMISKPNVSLWTQLIDAIEKNDLPWYAIGKHLTVMESTGPARLTYVANRYDRTIVVLPLIFFNPSDIKEIDDGLSKQKAIEAGAMVYSTPGSSWHSWDSSLINFFYIHTDLFIFLIILFVIWIIYIFMKKRYVSAQLESCQQKLL